MNTPTNHVKHGRELTATEKWSYMIAKQTVRILAPNSYRKAGNIEVSAIRHLTKEMVNHTATTSIKIFKQHQAQLEAKLEREVANIIAAIAMLQKKVRWWRKYKPEFKTLNTELDTMREALLIIRTNHPPETPEQLAENHKTVEPITDTRPEAKAGQFPPFPGQQPDHIQ